MAEVKPKVSVLTAGLNLDADPLALAEGEYTYALNAVIRSTFIENIEGSELAASLPAGYMHNGQCSLDRNDTLVMICTASGESEIGIFENDSYRTIVNFKGLNFDIRFPIQVKYKLNYKGQRIAYWTSGNNPPMWINLEDPSFIKEFGPDGCTLIDTDRLDLDFMRIFKSYSRPCIAISEIVESGRIMSGSIFFTAQYADANSNGLTAWFPLIGPVAIFRDSLSQAKDMIAGIQSEQRTGKAVLLSITGADASFTHINIGIVRVDNGVRSAYRVATINTGSTQFLYTGAGDTESAVDLADIIKPAVSYSRAKTIESTDQKLLLGNLRSEADFNFQPYISKLQVNWQLFTAWSDDTKNSHKDPIFAAYMKVMRQDEVYALGAVIEFTDGTESKAWHIPGRRKNLKADGTPFGPGIIKDQFGDDIDSLHWDDAATGNTADVFESEAQERYKIYNTALVTGSLSAGTETGISLYGEMGYHESTNTYDCNKEIYGEDAGKPIRHHKMPDASIFHIHDGLDGGRAYQERVKINYLGIRLPNIDDVIASLPEDVRAKVKGWRLVVGDRTYNKTVNASGIVLNARKANWRYEGDIKDDFRIFPNYPLNDLRTDPYIDNAAPTPLSLGPVRVPNPPLIPGTLNYLRNTFFFHSADTHFKNSFLSPGELKINAEIYGKTDSYYEFVDGYPEFKEKSDDNDKAALQGVSIASYNNYRFRRKGETRRKLKDAFYVPFNSRVAGGTGNTPVFNLFRESSVLLSTTADVADPSDIDTSRFILNDTDYGLEEDEKLKETIRNRQRRASILYVTIKTSLPNQYGSLHDIRYNDSYSCRPDIGLPANVVFAGDTYIGKLAFRTQHAFYQNIQSYVSAPDGMNGADFMAAETIPFTRYYYRNRGTGGNPRNQSNMMSEDNVGHGILGIGGDGNATGLGWLALMMFGIPTFYTESDLNIELRNAGETVADTFYPNLNNGTFKMNEFLSVAALRRDNTYLVNEDFSAKNNIKLIEGISPLYDPAANEQNHYSTRVIYTLDSQPEDINDNWLRFLPLDYYDLPKTKGELIDIRYLGNYRTIFRTERGTFLDTLYTDVPTSQGALSIGSGKLFQKVPTEMLTTDNIYAGTSSQLAFNRTPEGAFFLCARSGKCFSITDRLQEITEGVSIWLQDNMPLNLPKQISVPSVDNAYNPEGIGYLSAWDPIYQMWMITKKDYSVIDKRNISQLKYVNGTLLLGSRAVSLRDKTLFEDKSWTFAYMPEKKRWVSWMSFIPDFYLLQDLAFYAGINGNQSGFWKHNSHTLNHTFFGRKFPFMVENADKLDGINAFTNPTISFITRTVGQLDDAQRETFNKAWLYNLYEFSGELNLIRQDENKLWQLFTQLGYTDKSREVALRYREGRFNFSDFYDIRRFLADRMFSNSWSNADYRDAYPIDKVPDHSSLDYNKQEGDYSLLRERWLKYRLILDNRHDLKLLVQFVIMNNRESIS